MKQLMKRLIVTGMAVMMAVGMQMMSFAAVSTSSEAPEPALVSEASGLLEESQAGTARNTDGTINASPNTGVGIGSVVAAILAVGMVPVILKTRK